jgi:hypothetical protein
MEWKEKLLSENQVLRSASDRQPGEPSCGGADEHSSLSFDFFWKSCRYFLWLTGTQTDQNSVQISQIPECDEPAYCSNQGKS